MRMHWIYIDVERIFYGGTERMILELMKVDLGQVMGRLEYIAEPV